MFTPKSLLRHPEAKSSFDDMLPGQYWQKDGQETEGGEVFPSKTLVGFMLCYLKCVCVCYSAATIFKRLIPDEGPAAASPEKVKRIIFCSGKIYYELTRERKNRGMDDTVAVIRIEQVTKE